MYDCIIIGKGPAGITAAIYLKRAGINCLVIGKDGGSLEKTHLIENYYGFIDPIEGKELIRRGIEQAKRFEIPILEEEVIRIKLAESDKGFVVQTLKKDHEAKTVILATGVNRKRPVIKGIKEWEGKGVSYCAVCDAFFYRNKEVAVLGEGEYAYSEIEDLLPVAKKVTLLTNGKKAPEKRIPGIDIIEKKVKEVVGDRSIESAIFEDNSKIKIDGLFIAEGTASSLDFARKLGAILDGQNIKVNEKQETNIPGLYAAGDCTGGILQISKAIYDGTRAAFSVIEYIKKKRKE